ncbi:MAG: ComEC/Rec2 family competence protein [Candidatus Omnitrophota bacterium]|nr:ComEC/Rec2 family competence protein [Candidatus Omnitrophota bacterium]
MHRPLFVIGILFCVGICLERFIHIPFLALYLLAVFAITASIIVLRQTKLSTLFILIFYLVLGGIFYSNATTFKADHISKLSFIKNQPIFLKGIITSEPKYRSPSKISTTNFIVEAKEINLLDNWYKISGKVLVRSFAKYNFSYGDYLILEGKLFAPKNFYLGGKLNYANYLLAQGIHFIFSIRKNNRIEQIAKNQANFLKAISLKAKNKIQNIIRQNLSLSESAILEAIILGERSFLSKEINNLFIQTGTAHILAISGFNVGIVTFIELIFLRALHINRKVRFGITIILIIVYCILTGASPSVVRASIMAIVFLVGILLERETEIYNSLSFAALIILALNPQTLFDVGFQLSFISVISIVWMSAKIEKSILKWLNIKSRMLIWLLRSVTISISAYIGVLGLTVYYFNILTPVTLLANLFIVPLVSFLIVTGLCLIVAGSIFPAIAFVFANSTKFCIDILLRSAYLFSKLPLAYFYLKSINIYPVLVYYLLVIAAFSLIRPAQPKL